MAEAFVNKIEDFLACAICFERLKDPVGLPCLHGFCFDCLQDWHKASSPDKTQVNCPACRKSTPLPENGIRGFPGHFLVNILRETVDMQKQVSTNTTNSAPCDLCTKPADSHCLDCKQYLCKQCNKQHDAFKLMKDHKVVAASDILSGKISSQGRHCQVHGEMIRFYCNSEDKQVCHDCVTLKTCAFEHDRVPLSEAAKKHVEILKQLISAVASKKETYHLHLSKTDQIKTSLDTSYQKANENLETVITETTEKLEELLQNKIVILTDEYSMKDKQLSDAQEELKSKVLSFQRACSLAEDVISHGSDHEITFKYSTLKTTMESIDSSKDQYDINESLGNLSFEPGKPEDYIKLRSDSPTSKKHEQEEPPETKGTQTSKHASDSWTLSKHYHICNSLTDIAICPNGELAIASEKYGAKTFSAIGTFDRTLENAPKRLYAIAVTPRGTIITIGRFKLLCYNIYGTQVATITTMAPPVAIAVDKKDRIIAGLNNRVISIHNRSGESESLFHTNDPLEYISATSQNTLVVTIYNDLNTRKLLLMTYDGSFITEIKPTNDAIQWDPMFTCCNSRDEIFVVNTACHCIFWFAHEGQFIGRVTSDVECPRGLTASSDDELIVTEARGAVKYFVKPK